MKLEPHVSKWTRLTLLLALISVQVPPSSHAVESAKKTPALTAACMKAKALIAAGQYDQAEALAEKIAVEFKSPELLPFFRAQILIEKGLFREAAECYDQCAKLKSVPWAEPGRCMCMARWAVQCFTNLFNDNNRAFDEVYFELCRQNKLNYIINALEAHLKKRPDDFHAASLLAYVYLGSGSYKRYFETLKLVRPQSAERDFLEACCKVQTLNVKGAIKLLLQLRKTKPSSLVSARLASALALTDKVDAAVRMNEEARQQRSRLPLIVLNDAAILWKQKDYSKCLQTVDRYLSLAGKDSLGLTLRIQVLLQLDRQDEAGKCLLANIENPMEQGSSKYYSLLSGFYMSINKPLQALQCLDRSIEKEPSNSEWYYLRAKIEDDLWLFNETIEDCRLALKYNPKNRLAAELKQRAQEQSDCSKGSAGSGLSGITRRYFVDRKRQSVR